MRRQDRSLGLPQNLWVPLRPLPRVGRAGRSFSRDQPSVGARVSPGEWMIPQLSHCVRNPAKVEEKASRLPSVTK